MQNKNFFPNFSLFFPGTNIVWPGVGISTKTKNSKVIKKYQNVNIEIKGTVASATLALVGGTVSI